MLSPLMSGEWTGATAEYFLQALIAAEQAVAAQSEDTRWDRIAGSLCRAGAADRLTGGAPQPGTGRGRG